MCLNSKQLFKYCINARTSKAISGNNDKANDGLGLATERRGERKKKRKEGREGEGKKRREREEKGKEGERDKIRKERRGEGKEIMDW